MRVLPQGIFAEGYDPPEDHGEFVHIVFWVRRGKGSKAKKVPVDLVILPRAVVYGARTPSQIAPPRRLHS